MKNKIAFACDHAGVDLKNELIKYLEKSEYSITDFGTHTTDSADYPDFAHPMAKAVENNEFIYGISICGSGNGINMTVNKYSGIRSALCWNTEISELARLHNNANICSLPARFISVELAKKIVDIFFKTDFEGGRHQRRIDKISKGKIC